MGSRFGWMALAVVILCLAAPGAEAKPEKGKVFQDWKIDCQVGPDKQEKCLAFHVGMSEDGKKVFDIAFGYVGPNGEPAVIATLPLGISLREGAALKVDERPLLPLQINTCRPDGCEAVAKLDDATLAAVRAAKSVALGVIPYGTTQPVGIPVSIKGLGAAVGSLK